MRLTVFFFFILIGCTSGDKKSCPCSTGNEVKTKPTADSSSQVSREEIQSKTEVYSSQSNLSSYQAWASQLARSCRYSSLPSRLITYCQENNLTYDLSNQDNEELYYFELLSSKHPTDRRKSYSYFQKNCSARAPFIPFLEEKSKRSELEEWERKEISESIQVCQSSQKSDKMVDYNETGFYFDPSLSIGNGDFYFIKKNKSSDPLPLNYRIESENAEVIMLEEKKNYSYLVPSGSTLDTRRPALVVGNREVKIKVIEETSVSTNEYNISGYLHSSEKGFSPSYWNSKKKFPVYYYSSSENVQLKASLFKRSSSELINSQIMNFISKRDDLYLYKSEIDLKGYSGEVDVTIERLEGMGL